MNVDTRGYVDDSIQDSCVERGPDPAVSRPQMDQDYPSFYSIQINQFSQPQTYSRSKKSLDEFIRAAPCAD